MRILVLVGVALGLGCADDLTQIVIETETDYEASTELARVEWEIRGSADELIDPTPELVLTTATSFPLRLTLVPASSRDSRVRVTARAFAPDGSLLVAQSRTTQFVPGVSSVLRMELSRRCAGERCDEGSTCFNINDEPRCASGATPAESLPLFAAGRVHGMGELCNDRDDDGDGIVDEDFDFDTSARHCGLCFAGCADPVGGNGVPSCSASECSYECATGFGDCDGDESNGCESDLALGATCGSCSNACADPTPICRSAASGECVDSCGDVLTTCETECVDLETSESHCGGCGIACPDVGPLGVNECVAGDCVPDCEDGAHPCGDTCVSSSSVDSCGIDVCERCPGEGAAGVSDVLCVNESCVLDCEPDRFDCNGNLSDGCETDATSSDSNCGGCGIDCGYGSCVAGLCNPSVSSFALGPRHTCAVLSDDTVWCWGANESGQSAPTRSSVVEPSPVLVRTDSGRSPRFESLDDRTSYLKHNYLLALNPVGEVRMWGLDPRTDPSTASALVNAQLYVSLSGARTFDVGNGTLFFVGYEDGTSADLALQGAGRRANAAFAPFGGPDDGSYVDITVLDRANPPGLLRRGRRETCMSDVSGGFPRLLCWGTGTVDEPAYLGNGTVTGSSTPVVIAPVGQRLDDDERTFDVGFGAACAPFEGPSGFFQYCWGDWDCGPFDSLTPQILDEFTSGAIPNIEVGESIACAVETSRLVCWGRNLVDGSCSATSYEPVPGLEGVGRFGLRLGRSHGCYERRGQLYCWGSNSDGQLGTGPGTVGRTAAPTQVVFGMGS